MVNQKRLGGPLFWQIEYAIEVEVSLQGLHSFYAEQNLYLHCRQRLLPQK